MGREMRWTWGLAVGFAFASYLAWGNDLTLQRDTVEGCENVVHVGERLISGGEPHSEGAFRALAQLGVRTILSVDGGRPDVEAARKAGIRYIHLPVGYDGINRERAVEIGEALKTGRGKIYVHCHHGKHRGPAALAMGLIVQGLWNAEEAHAYLVEAGTSPNYAGLFHDVARATPATKAEWKGAPKDLPETSDVGELATSMALVDRAIDGLAASKAADWGLPADHPDIVPSREASMIVDLFRGAKIDEGDYDDVPGLRKLMAESALVAEVLQTALEKGDKPTAESAYTALREHCEACHSVWRN